MAYVRNDPISFKGSASALPNNLSVIPCGRDYDIAVINKSTAHVVRVDKQGVVKSQVHLKYGHPSVDKPVNITQVRYRILSVITLTDMQVKYCRLVDKSVIVITCFGAVQVSQGFVGYTRFS